MKGLSKSFSAFIGKVGRSLTFLGFVSLGVASAGALDLFPTAVNALEGISDTISNAPPALNRVAVRSNWQGASFPVENFQTYTSPFGYRSSPTGGGGREFHRGLDLAAPEGSYVRNWWTGRVADMSDHTACGTSIFIKSGNWTHVYCHLKGRVETIGGQKHLVDRSGGIQLRLGQTVTAGERIGRVGMTGRTTGPHLHWGLKYAGEYIDPALVLRAMYAEQRRRPVFTTGQRPN